jgi:hypothetical protein
MRLAHRWGARNLNHPIIHATRQGNLEMMTQILEWKIAPQMIENLLARPSIPHNARSLLEKYR